MIKSNYKFDLGKNYSELDNEKFKIDVSQTKLRMLERQEKKLLDKINL